MIGRKIKLEYADQNEAYSVFLPRVAVIEKRLESDNVDNWYLIKLAVPYKYGGVENKQLLIRSRWKDVEIGETENVSVFIVQIPDKSVIKGSYVKIEASNLVAWGTVSLE